jgi:hypothetical protein
MNEPIYIYFLGDYTYNISHTLSKFIDKNIVLIYICYNNLLNELDIINKLYIQETVLKHIIKLGFTFNVKYVMVDEVHDKLLCAKNNIYLNKPNLISENICVLLDNYKILSYDNIINNSLSIVNESIILKDLGHGFDEETIIYSYITSIINGDNLEIINKNLNLLKIEISTYVKPNIIYLEKKINIFKSIYNININKKTIIFCDNYLLPFLTIKDIGSYEEYICFKIINLLINLKKNFNVVVRFHPLNENGIKQNKEFPDILFNNFIIDFTPFELGVLYNNCDILISNRYTSCGYESIFYDCKTFFIDYNFDKRKQKPSYLEDFTNKIFDELLATNYIVNNSIIKVVYEDNLDINDILELI